MCPTTAGTQFGDRVVVTVANIEGVVLTPLRQPNQKYNRFIIDDAIEILEGYASVPGTNN